MMSGDALGKLVLLLVPMLAPAVIGWGFGSGGRGKRLVRTCAGLALLIAIAGASLIGVGVASPSGRSSAPGNDFGSGSVGYIILGGALLVIAVVCATMACGAALAQTRYDGRRGWLAALLITCALPLGLSMTFFTLNLFHVWSSGSYLLGSGICGAFAILGVAAYALFGLAGSGPGEAPVSTRAH